MLGLGVSVAFLAASLRLVARSDPQAGERGVSCVGLFQKGFETRALESKVIIWRFQLAG